METILNRLLREKIVAIVRGVRLEEIEQTADALLTGGVSALEVTFDQSSPAAIENTLGSIRCLREKYAADICLGAGTVLTAEQVRLAQEAGAQYMISPNTDAEVILAAKTLGCVSIPGAMTPSEAVAAHRAGADIVKLFPAGVLGPAYIKAMCGPLGFLHYFAVGGINEKNAADFIKAGACGVGVGGNLVSVKAIRNGEFAFLTETARAYVQNLNGV